MTKFNRKNVIEAIKDSAGIKSIICNRIGIQRRILNIWLEKHSDLNELYLEETERVLDKAESSIIKKVNEGIDMGTLRWYLSTKGKHRGYTETHINIQTQGQTKISLNIPKEVLDVINKESNGTDK